MAISPFKTHSDFFYDIGMIHKWTADEMMGVVKSSIDAPAQFYSDSWEDNPNTFRNLGENIGGVAQATWMMRVNAGFLVHSARRSGRPNAISINRGGTIELWGEEATGDVFSKLETRTTRLGGTRPVLDKGIPKRASGLGTMSKEALKDAAKADGAVLSEGVLSRSYNRLGPKFLESQGFVKGALAMAAPMVALGMLRGTLGLAGSFIDQAMGEFKKSRKHYYDTRYFNTEEANMSSYQQIGMAMRSQEQRYLSVARIMHSR